MQVLVSAPRWSSPALTQAKPKPTAHSRDLVASLRAHIADIYMLIATISTLIAIIRALIAGIRILIAKISTHTALISARMRGRGPWDAVTRRE